MPDDLFATVRHEQESAGVVHGGGEACGPEVARPAHVDARIPGVRVLGEQGVAARDQPLQIGLPGAADDGFKVLVAHPELITHAK
ncbi:hypothetical protein [Streptomyces sp. NPDC001222]|uniref:hypothetical protein n=1 Tax=Streptomyces sp. NPDC001222 TaxID=3364548 RepID=UPI00367B341A